MEETATSLSLYSSRSFFTWRGIQRDLEINIAGFIENEMQCSRLRQDGWDIETLHALFDLEFSPVDRHYYCEDEECKQEFEELPVERSWQILHGRIKRGKSLAGRLH